MSRVGGRAIVGAKQVQLVKDDGDDGRQRHQPDAHTADVPQHVRHKAVVARRNDKAEHAPHDAQQQPNDGGPIDGDSHSDSPSRTPRGAALR